MDALTILFLCIFVINKSLIMTTDENNAVQPESQPVHQQTSTNEPTKVLKERTYITEVSMISKNSIKENLTTLQTKKQE